MFAVIGAALIGYLLGSIPSGYLIVKVATGQDVRKHGSGRTGGSNVGRMVGTWGFILTAVLDGAKGFVAVLLTRQLMGGLVAGSTMWPEVIAGVASVVGHNWSIYMGFAGGAGTAPSMGAGIALWPWSGVLAALVGLSGVFILSMASVGSLAAVISLALIFAIRALSGAGPWEHAVYGIGAALVVVWALRPNIQRLRSGTERRLWFGLNKAKDSPQVGRQS